MKLKELKKLLEMIPEEMQDYGLYPGVYQRLDCQAHNLEVVGSSPTSGTNGQLGERFKPPVLKTGDQVIGP